MSRAPIVTVRQEVGRVVPTEVLATSIVALSEGMRELRSGRLNDHALMLLIAHAAPIPKGARSRLTVNQIRAALDGVAALERTFIRPQE